MAEPNDAQVVSALMRMLGKTYCEEAGIAIGEGTTRSSSSSSACRFWQASL